MDWKRLRPHATMLGVVAIWGGAFAAIKVALLGGLTPFELILARFLLAAPLFLILLAVRGVPRFSRAEWGRVALVAFLSVAGYHLALNTGETQIAAGTAALIVATGPIWTAIVSAAVAGERFTAWKAIGLVVSLIGVAILVFGHGDEVSLRYVGFAFVALLAPIGWAFSSVTSKPLVGRHDPIAFSAVASLLGTLFLLPFLPFATFSHFTHAPMAAWVAVGFLGVFATVVGYVGFNSALSELSATETIAYVYLNPVFGVFWSRLFLGESVTFAVVGGGILVILGVALAQKRTESKARLPGLSRAP